MIYPCPRCGSSTIEWEIYSWGKTIQGQKCICCGQVTSLEDILKARASAGKERANVSDPEKPREENKRICKKCGKNPTIAKQFSFCSACKKLLAQEAKERKDAALKEGNEPQEKKTPEPREKPTREKKEAPGAPADPAGGENTILVDFAAYAGLLREIKKLAEEEIRPVNLQIIFILKSHLREEKRSLTDA